MKFVVAFLHCLCYLIGLAYVSGANIVIPGDTILFVGDSTAFYGYLNGGFMHQVLEKLESYNISNVELAAVTMPESSTSLESLVSLLNNNYPEELPSAANSARISRIAVVMVGIDEILRGENIHSFSFHFQALINTLFRKGTKEIVVLSPTIFGEKVDGTNPADDAMEEYGGLCERIVENWDDYKPKSLTSNDNAEDSPANAIYYLDTRMEILHRLEKLNHENLPAGIFTHDGKHLNPAGHDFISSMIVNFLCETCHRQHLVDNDFEAIDHRPVALQINPDFFVTDLPPEIQDMIAAIESKVGEYDRIPSERDEL